MTFDVALILAVFGVAAALMLPLVHAVVVVLCDGFPEWLDQEELELRCNKGGEAPKPPDPEPMPKLEPIKLPKPPKPPPPPPPVPTETAADVQRAKTDQRLQERKRNGLLSTLLAGETGGFNQNGKKTLLG